MENMKVFRILILLYLFFSVLFVLPMIFLNKSGFISNILNLFKFNLSFYSIILSVLSVILIWIYDYFEKYSLNLKEKLLMFENIFGINPGFIDTASISIFSGFFEELFFRGYLYYIFLFLFNLFIKNSSFVKIFTITIISIVFGLFHFVQGFKAFLFSLFISVVFFITINLSGNLYYAVFFHAIFNFVEIKYIYTYKIKRFIKKSSN